MTVIAFANRKGGVGKTTIAAAYAHAAVAAGQTVLIIDADPQSNTTIHLTEYTKETPAPVSLADVLDPDTRKSILEAIVNTRRAGLDVVPAGGLDLDVVQNRMASVKLAAEKQLTNALAPALPYYDTVIIDCPPSLDMVTLNALVAANRIVIVAQPEEDAINGMDKLMDTLEQICLTGHRYESIGVLINQLDARRKDHAKGVNFIRTYAENNDLALLGHPVPRLTEISKITNMGEGFDQNGSSAQSRHLAKLMAQIVEEVTA